MRAMRLTPTSAAALPERPKSFGHYVPDYTGPEDGLSTRKHDWLTKPLNVILSNGRYRLEVQGKEKMIHEGPQVYASGHPSFFDPPLVALLSDRDMRYVANVYVFDGLRGRVMTWGGAFPVHRENPSPTTINHAIDLLKEGKGVCIFPEGAITEKLGTLLPIKKGAAYFALKGGAENIVPIGVFYKKNDREYPGEKLATALASAGVAVAGLVAGAVGGPGARVAVAALGGALTGAVVGGNLGNKLVPIEHPNDPFPNYFATLQGGAGGALAGAIAAGGAAALLDDSQALIAGLSGLSGAVSTWALGQAWMNRDLAQLRIGDPIEVAPYRAMKQSEGVTALTEELHRRIGKETATLSGIPYDESAPKIRGRIVEDWGRALAESKKKQ